jgi:hypothetical protein
MSSALPPRTDIGLAAPHFSSAVEKTWFPGAHADIGEDKTAGGIIIPDSAKEKPSQGEILSV